MRSLIPTKATNIILFPPPKIINFLLTQHIHIDSSKKNLSTLTTYSYEKSFKMSYRIQKASQKANQKANGCMTIICTLCGKKTHSRRAMILHRQTKHSLEYLKCDHCDEAFDVREHLLDHLKQTHESVVAYCTDCGTAYKNKDSLRKHQQQYHGTFPCLEPGCNFKSSTANVMKSHFASSHGSRDFACNECEKRYRNATMLANHVESTHATFRCTCKVEGCNAEFRHPYLLRTHVAAMHVVRHEEDIKCKTCGRNFGNKIAAKAGLDRHMNTVHWLDGYKAKFGKAEKGEEDGLSTDASPAKLSLTGK